MNKSAPLVTVIVPVYNVETYLDKCIQSILKQSYKNLEIILVNDGSTDGSYTICKEYQKKDPRIKLINKKNGGLSEARNFGIDNATGKYLAFTDSDDYLHPEMILNLTKTIIEEDADIVICGHFVVKNKTITEIRNDGKFYRYDKKEALCKILNDKHINSFAWDKIYKKELFINLRYPLGRIFEDTAFTYKLFEKATKIIQLNNSYYYYVLRENSISHAPNPKKNYHNFLAFFERYQFASKKLPQMKEICAEKALKQGVSIIDESLIKQRFVSENYTKETITKMNSILDEIKISSLTSVTLRCKLRVQQISPHFYKLLYVFYNKIKG